MRKTPLYDEHVALDAKVVDFHGWALPVQYTGIVQEHLHTRSQVTLFDTCHMGEFLVRGRDRIAAFDNLWCGDASSLALGRCRYGVFLNTAGGIIDDTIVMRLAEDELYVVTNAGPLDAVSALLTSSEARAEDLSEATAKIDVQGPQSRDVLTTLGFKDAATLAYYRACRSRWREFDIVLSRTGYTGELGYEIYLPVEAAVPLWRALLKVDGVLPAGLGARDTLRTEMGYTLSGQDFDETRTPLEANLARFIKWDKDFVGREALVAQRNTAHDLLVGLRTPDRRAPRHGFEIARDGSTVGIVTSGTFGPSVGHGIGLGYLPKDFPKDAAGLNAGPRDLPVALAVLPFYTAGTSRD
jgi:aminomethyltransferase